MNTTLQYPYKMNTLLVLALSCLFALCAYNIYQDSTTARGLVIDQVIHLTPEQAHIFLLTLAILMAVFVVAGLLIVALNLTHKHFIKLSTTELSAPRYIWSTQNTVVRMQDIIKVQFMTVGKQIIVYVRHSKGKLPLAKSCFPDAESFETFMQMLDNNLKEVRK